MTYKACHPFQRILLTTDGTVTEILEAQFYEQIQLVKLFLDTRLSEADIPFLQVKAGTEVLVRKILLQGGESKTNYIYAESLLVPEHLDAALQSALHTTSKPIGRLLIEAKTETFREILTCRKEKAEELAEHFSIGQDAQLISRTYRILANNKPIMLITEKFPEQAFV